MSLKEIVTELDLMLEQAGLDFASPNPKLAWQVFKDFARLPIDSEGIKAGSVTFELSHYADRDDELWIGFSRDVHFAGEDGKAVASTAVGCHLRHTVPDKLIGINKAFGSSRLDDFQQYFKMVEGRSEFQICMQLPDWKWEKTHWPWANDEE